MSPRMMILILAILAFTLWGATPAGAQSPFNSTDLEDTPSPYTSFQAMSLTDSGDVYGISEYDRGSPPPFPILKSVAGSAGRSPTWAARMSTGMPSGGIVTPTEMVRATWRLTRALVAAALPCSPAAP